MSDPWNFGEFVGQDTFKRGFEYFRSGMAHGIAHTLDGEIVGQVDGSGRAKYSTLVSYVLGGDGRLELFEGDCSCPVYEDCKHAVALLLTSFAQDGIRPSAPIVDAGPAAWEQSMTRLVDIDAEQQDTAEPLGLAFELIEPTGPTTVGRYRTNGQPGRLGVRPVRLGKRGRWIRTGISWADLSGLAAWGFRVDHVRLLRAMVAADPSVYPWQHGANNPWIALASIRNPVIWDLLDEAAEAELSLDDRGRCPSPGPSRQLRSDLRPRDRPRSLRRPHRGADVAARR